MVITEGALSFDFHGALEVRKFDKETEPARGHRMKAVDFIVELKKTVLFVEIKDPEDEKARTQNSSQFLREMAADKLYHNLAYKYRDSFLYEWAADRLRKKPLYYYVLIAVSSLTAAELDPLTKRLQDHLPQMKRSDWKRPLVEHCAVFNIAAWNKHLKQFPVSRAK
jgi:hypothetical protein